MRLRQFRPRPARSPSISGDQPVRGVGLHHGIDDAPGSFVTVHGRFVEHRPPEVGQSFEALRSPSRLHRQCVESLNDPIFGGRLGEQRERRRSTYSSFNRHPRSACRSHQIDAFRLELLSRSNRASFRPAPSGGSRRARVAAKPKPVPVARIARIRHRFTSSVREKVRSSKKQIVHHDETA